MLQRAGLIAPTYLTICGVAPGEGCVLSRDREGSEDGSCVAARLSDGELPRIAGIVLVGTTAGRSLIR